MIESVVRGGLNLDLVARSGKRQLRGIEDGAEQAGCVQVFWDML